jgi:uncharacterized protein with PIN domain
VITQEEGDIRKSVIRFVLDVHLAKLARHLRMLGYDSHWRSDLGDDELLRISGDEGRVLLTRDRELFGRADPSLRHYVQATDSRAQLAEVLSQFNLREEARLGSGFLTRCLECNSPIIPVKPQYISDRVPADLLQRHSEFFLCPRCERVYWKGSHWERMKIWVRRTLGEDVSSG